jgi:hypothetical protein
VGACEPKGSAPADAACSKTPEDAAKDRGKSAAYADGVKRVRLPAHPQAQPCARVASVGVCRVRVRVCFVCVLCACVKV